MKAAATAKAVTRRAAAASKPVAQLTQQELQAVFDRHRNLDAEGIRCLVTVKELGLFKKRWTETGLTDIEDFVKWITMHYRGVAIKQHESIKRDQKNGTGRLDKVSPLPMALTFSTLTYRFPYFAKVYASFKADRPIDEQVEDVKDKKIKALTAQVIDLKNATQVLRRRTVERTVPASPVRVPRAQPAKKTVDADCEIPTWDELTAKEEGSNARRA